MEKILNKMERIDDQIEAPIDHAVQSQLMTSPVSAGHKVLKNLMLIGSAAEREAPLGNRFVILGEKMANVAAGKGLYLTAQDSKTYPLILVPGGVQSHLVALGGFNHLG